MTQGALEVLPGILLELPKKKHIPLRDDKVLWIVSQEATQLSLPLGSESPRRVTPTQEKELSQKEKPGAANIMGDPKGNWLRPALHLHPYPPIA